MKTLKENIMILPKNQLESVLNCLKRITEDKESIYNVLMYNRKKDYHGLYESTINRIFWHINNDPGLKTFAILSAWKKELPAEYSQIQNKPSDEPVAISNTENRLRNNQLLATIRSMKYRYVTSLGEWCECSDNTIPYNKCPKELIVCYPEQSVIIFNITKEETMDLSWRYNQTAFIFWGREETGGKFVLHYMDNGVEETFSELSVAQERLTNSQVYTSIRGQRFVIDGGPKIENIVTFNMEDNRSIALYESWSHITEDIAYEIIKLSAEEKKDIVEAINKELSEV